MEYLTNPFCWIFLFISLLVTALLTPVVMRLARWLGAVDIGGYRKQYRGEMPLLGGLAVAVPFVLTCLYLSLDKTLDVDREPHY